MKTCPSCKAEVRDTARFCATCGATIPLAVFCDNCGGENSAAARFCRTCGASLASGAGIGVRSGPAIGAAGIPSSPQISAPLPAVPAAPPAAGAAQVGMTGRLPPQSIVAKRYLVVKKLGQGGMGAVYQVCDTRLGNRVSALKEMSDSAITDPQEKEKARQAFQREAHLLGMLSHPNLPRVTDYFLEGERQYLVMDFVEGQTLDDLVETRTKPFPESQVLQWARQLCDVLHYLHTRPSPIIFRDLKPGNIMISPDGQSLKLIDFGIARLFKPGARKDTQALGTPGFAAPEQYGKGQSDARSDVYALGATLHLLLTLRDPAADLFKFPPIRSLNSSISTRVAEAIQKAVERDPDQRWATVAEFRQALDGAAGSPQAAIPDPGLQPVAASSAAGSAIPAGPAVQPKPAPTPAPAPKPKPAPVPAPAPKPKPVPTPAPLPLAATGLAPADHGPRFGALVVDGVILSLVAGLAAAMMAQADPTTQGWAWIAVLLFAHLFPAWCIARSGRTPGKKLAGLRVVRSNGDPVGFWRALWRTIVFYWAVALLTLLTAGVPSGLLIYLVPLFNPEHRALHDYLADTRVVK